MEVSIQIRLCQITLRTVLLKLLLHQTAGSELVDPGAGKDRAHQAVSVHNKPFFVNIDGLSSGAPELL